MAGILDTCDKCHSYPCICHLLGNDDDDCRHPWGNEGGDCRCWWDIYGRNTKYCDLHHDKKVDFTYGNSSTPKKQTTLSFDRSNDNKIICEGSGSTINQTFGYGSTTMVPVCSFCGHTVESNNNIAMLHLRECIENA